MKWDDSMSKKRIFIYLACLFLALAIIWTILVVKGVFNQIDEKIVNWVVGFRGDKYNFLYWLARIITEGAYVYFIIPFLILIIVIYHCDLKSIILAIGTLFQLLVNTIIKSIIKRPRPNEMYHWMVETSASFPSGHSMTSSFLYGMLIYVLLKSNISKRRKIILSIISGIMIFMVCSSRIILSVHYTSDIIGGILWGGCLVMVGGLFNELFEHKWNGFKPLIDKKLVGDNK